MGFLDGLQRVHGGIAANRPKAKAALSDITSYAAKNLMGGSNVAKDLMGGSN